MAWRPTRLVEVFLTTQDAKIVHLGSARCAVHDGIDAYSVGRFSLTLNFKL
jgi:hypothetical protein